MIETRSFLGRAGLIRGFFFILYKSGQLKEVGASRTKSTSGFKACCLPKKTCKTSASGEIREESRASINFSFEVIISPRFSGFSRQVASPKKKQRNCAEGFWLTLTRFPGGRRWTKRRVGDTREICLLPRKSLAEGKENAFHGWKLF